jgi:amino acid transporter
MIIICTELEFMPRLLSIIENILFYNLTMSSMNLFYIVDERKDESNLRDILTPPFVLILVSLTMYLIFFVFTVVPINITWRLSPSILLILFLFGAILLSLKIIIDHKRYDTSNVSTQIQKSDEKQQKELKEGKKIKNLNGIKL